MNPYNFQTNVPGRVDKAIKNASLAQIHERKELAQKCLLAPSTRKLVASLMDVPVALYTNDDHLRYFWSLNWEVAVDKEPLIHVYAVMGIANQDPQAWYNSETKTAVLINTNYYGQIKSWALGALADFLETEKNILSLHASCLADEENNAVVIIGPTGGGKSVTEYGLLVQFPALKLVSDDWVFVKCGDSSTCHAAERWFYMRSDIVSPFPIIKDVMDSMPAENVVMTLEGFRDYSTSPQARVMVDPARLGKRGYLGYPKLVVVLSRDKKSEVEKILNVHQARELLMKGEFEVLPKSGPMDEWGKTKMEPWFNPYLLVLSHERLALQGLLFEKAFRDAKTVVINTALESPEQTTQRIVDLL